MAARMPSSAISSPSVAIIGAGLSGLTAAGALTDKGCSVRLFEKSRGPGGRMATRRKESYAFDHGAQYFTVKHERFRKCVAHWQEIGLVSEWALKLGVAEQGRLSEKQPVVKRFVGIPRMSAITRHLATPLTISYQTRVGRINREQSQWRLVSKSGAELGLFDTVLINTPPEQAMDFLDEAPEIAEQVGRVRMTPCWAVMLAFAQSLPIPYDGVFIHGAPLAWAARNSSKPERPAQESWILHGTPAWSEAHLEMDSAEIVPLLTTAFFDSLGLDHAMPIFGTAHRWRYAMAEEPLEAGYLWNADLRLGLCGDWCHGSRVEGAYLSGLALATHALG